MWLYVVLCGLLGNARLKKQGESPTPEPAGQRYLPTELMVALERQNNNLVVWMAILARLYGTGLK